MSKRRKSKSDERKATRQAKKLDAALEQVEKFSGQLGATLTDLGHPEFAAADEGPGVDEDQAPPRTALDGLLDLLGTGIPTVDVPDMGPTGDGMTQLGMGPDPYAGSPHVEEQAQDQGAGGVTNTSLGTSVLVEESNADAGLPDNVSGEPPENPVPPSNGTAGVGGAAGSLVLVAVAVGLGWYWVKRGG